MGKTQVVYGRRNDEGLSLAQRIVYQTDNIPSPFFRLYQERDKITPPVKTNTSPIFKAQQVFYFTRRRQHPQARN